LVELGRRGHGRCATASDCDRIGRRRIDSPSRRPGRRCRFPSKRGPRPDRQLRAAPPQSHGHHRTPRPRRPRRRHRHAGDRRTRRSRLWLHQGSCTRLPH
jgi:hypothetical protein